MNRLREGEDGTRIRLKEDFEIRYWTRELAVSKERLLEAMAAIGPTVEQVRKYLREHPDSS